jgi:hypothetical protein
MMTLLLSKQFVFSSSLISASFFWIPFLLARITKRISKPASTNSVETRKQSILNSSKLQPSSTMNLGLWDRFLVWTFSFFSLLTWLLLFLLPSNRRMLTKKSAPRLIPWQMARQSWRMIYTKKPWIRYSFEWLSSAQTCSSLPLLLYVSSNVLLFVSLFSLPIVQLISLSNLQSDSFATSPRKSVR